jgi:hypothetical protein
MEKKLQGNARWNVNKTIRCLVRNKIKHQKKIQDREMNYCFIIPPFSPHRTWVDIDCIGVV